MAKPVCRYCGTRVGYFGDVCALCGGEPDEGTDAFARMVRDDEDALRP